MTRADGRPRVHIWPHAGGCYVWSIGPDGTRARSERNAGDALNKALEHLGVFAGVVVILEKQP